MQQQERRRDQTFFTPQTMRRVQADRLETPRGALLIAGCRAGTYLSRRVGQRYQALMAASGSGARVAQLDDVDFAFANTESCVRLDRPVSGCDAYLFQGLCDPTGQRSIDQNYLAALMAVRALREHGAEHVTAVLPYLAYGRQDKPTEFQREPTTARLMADLMIAAGIDRLVAWHPHCAQIRGFYGALPVHMLSPLTLFVESYWRFRGRRDTIVVAPDAGASELVTSCGRALELDCAIGSKHRPRQDVSEITQIIGDFAGKRTAIVLDDEISTGGSILNVVRRIVEEHGIEAVYLGVSHNRCVEQARVRLLELHERYGLQQVLVTNSIPQTAAFTQLPFVKVSCLSDALARTVNRIHCNQSVSEVFYRP